MELVNLFNNLILYGKYVRTNQLDGLEYWNKIKEIVTHSRYDSINNILGSKWVITRIINDEQPYKQVDNLKEIYSFVHDNLRMYGEEGDEVKYNIDHDLWSKYHFYLQLARIPVKNNLDLGRLLQIAYNLGQLSVHLNDDYIFTSKSKEYFETNQLNNINSYINLDGKILNKLEKDTLNNIEIYVKQIIDKTLLEDFERKPFYGNLKELTIDNKNYRKVLYTGKQQQLVLINLKPNDFIKQEGYDTIDQFIRVEKGNGIVIIDDIDYELKDGIELIIPAGSQHKIVNTSSTNLSLYTIYSPPEYAKTLVQESNPELKTTYLNKYFKYKKKYLSLKNKLNNHFT